MRIIQSPWYRSAALLIAALPACADQASKQARIDEMMALTNAETLMRSTLDQFRSMIKQQIKQVLESDARLRPHIQELQPMIAEHEDQVVDVLQKALNWKELKPKMSALYGETFSEEDLDSIVLFYKTPAGQNMLQKMPDLMKRAMQIGQEQVQAGLPELQRLDQEFRDKLKKWAADKDK